jgi:hypothetical protein
MGRAYKKPEIRSYATSDVLEEIGPCQNQYLEATLHPDTGNSGGNVDGYVVSAGVVNTNTTIFIGDFVANTYVRGFVGFDISSLAGRSVISATLRMYQSSVLGIPYVDLGGTMVVDHVDFGSSIGVSDLAGGTLTPNVGTISTTANSEWKTLGVTGYVQADIDSGRTTSQFRLRFSTDTDSNNDSDYALLEGAENFGGSGNVPELVVIYR